MICFIALIIFAVLGIFSVKYRNYFFEAADCVFRKVTLRKCTTSFDKKMKMKVSAKLSKFNKPTGSFVFKNFDLISWMITLLMIISLVWTAYAAFTGIYNWYAFGNCNGPDSGGLCVYNALTGANVPAVSTISSCSDVNLCGTQCVAKEQCGTNCSCDAGVCSSVE